MPCGRSTFRCLERGRSAGCGHVPSGAQGSPPTRGHRPRGSRASLLQCFQWRASGGWPRRCDGCRGVVPHLVSQDAQGRRGLAAGGPGGVRRGALPQERRQPDHAGRVGAAGQAQAAALGHARAGERRRRLLPPLSSSLRHRSHAPAVLALAAAGRVCQRGGPQRGREQQTARPTAPRRDALLSPPCPALPRARVCAQNDLSEFYALFHVAVPGLLGEAPQFRKTYEL